MDAKHILIVEDDYPIATFVQTILEREGFLTDIIDHGDQVLTYLSHASPDLIVLDLMLPGMNGLALCNAIRQMPNYIPIIILTAKGDEVDKVLGLEIGADDYITKPFKSRELVARVRAILRLANHSNGSSKEHLVFDMLEIDLKGRVVKLSGQTISLTPKEFDLLELMASNPRRVMGREMLLDRVWGYQYEGESRTVDVHIQRLRQKIEPDPRQPRFLITVRNIGYKFLM